MVRLAEIHAIYIFDSWAVYPNIVSQLHPAEFLFLNFDVTVLVMFDPFVSPWFPLQNDSRVSFPLTIHKPWKLAM